MHHGQDSKYVDRNFGGVLIVWDRLFGTFQVEEEEPRYGASLRPGSWNPVWANLHGFAWLVARWRQARGWRARLQALFGPPESSATPLGPAPVLADPPPGMVLYAAGHLGLAVAATLGVVLNRGESLVARGVAAPLVLITLESLGGLLDGRPWAPAVESARLCGVMLAVLLLSPSSELVIGLGIVAALSGLWLRKLWRPRWRPQASRNLG